jgi:DNA-binding beta-propeller fold protein YncE
MPTDAFHRRPGSARALATLAAVLVAVSACGSSGAVSPPTGSAPSKATSSAPETSAPSTPTVAASASPLPALSLLWEKGAPSTVRADTYWPAIDPLTGNVWVASSFDNQYWIFGADGKFLEAWGAPGKGPGQFQLTTNDPKPDAVGAIAFAPDGSFYVVDNGNYRVEKFDKNRHFVTMWGSFGTGDGQFANPKGIATDGKTVYVADDPRFDIQAFDTTGRFLRSFPFPFVLFSRAPTGHLFVADETGVLELDGIGKQIRHLDLDFTALGGYPAQTAVDKAGDIFVELQTDAPVGLVELDSRGRILHDWSVGGETMALAPDGKAVYVACYGWDFIRKYALP